MPKPKREKIDTSIHKIFGDHPEPESLAKVLDIRERIATKNYLTGQSESEEGEDDYEAAAPDFLEKTYARLEKFAHKHRKALVAAGLAGVVAAVAAREVQLADYNSRGSKVVPEYIRPGEGLISVAKRAEDEYGKDPQNFNAVNEGNALSQEYPNPQPGDRIMVHIK